MGSIPRRTSNPMGAMLSKHDSASPSPIRARLHLNGEDAKRSANLSSAKRSSSVHEWSGVSIRAGQYERGMLYQNTSCKAAV